MIESLGGLQVLDSRGLKYLRLHPGQDLQGKIHMFMLLCFIPQSEFLWGKKNQGPVIQN